jgi:hypothetical protein
MRDLNPRKLTREQIARALVNPSHEIIKAFEALFRVGGETPEEIQTLTLLIQNTQETADSALAGQYAVAAQISRLANAVELMAVAPVIQPAPVPEQHTCEACSALREDLLALARRVADLEAAP